jgi:ABC-type polysaccharide/polyol phosphate export permease
MLLRRLLNEPWGQKAKGEFGGRVGIWRILDMFDANGVKVTLFTPGRICELYPDALKRAVAAGHELADHMWEHEVPKDLAIEEAHLTRTVAALQKVSGKPVTGTRSSHTPSLLRAKGIVYNSFTSAAYRPFYELDAWGGNMLLQLPFHYALDDAMYFSFGWLAVLTLAVPASGALAQEPLPQTLIVRELRTRFGRYRLGYLWAVLEPAAHVVLLSLIFAARGRSDLAGIDLPVLIITGIVPFLLFRSTVIRAMSAVEANSGLFGYRQVKPFDAVLARLILGGVIYLLVLALLLLGATYFGYRVAVRDPLTALAALGLLAGFAAGCGLIACALACRFEETKRVVPVLLRPLYFLSGVFFTLDAIPASFHGYLLWNPVLHAVELFRASTVAIRAESHGDFGFLALAALVAVFIGLALFRRDRFAMVAT